MTYRTTEAQVQGIIKTNASITITPFIEVANALVTELCASSGYDDTRLELIERWLAAHFYSVRDAGRLTERAGPVSKQIESRVDLGFDVTRHGQMAMRIDTAGNLAALNEQSKRGASITPGVTWLGTEEEEEDE